MIIAFLSTDHGATPYRISALGPRLCKLSQVSSQDEAHSLIVEQRQG